MATLDYIAIKGFKSIKDIKVEIKKLNVIIGANGSGKSNLLGAIDFLSQVRWNDYHNYTKKAGGASRLLHFGPKLTQSIELEARYFFHEYAEYQTAVYHARLEKADTDEFYLATESLSEGDNPPRSLKKASHENVTGSLVRSNIARLFLYHLNDTSDSSPLKGTSEVQDTLRIKPSGENLAAFLYKLKIYHPSEYGAIVRTIQLVAPFFRDFELEPEGRYIRLRWIHTKSDWYSDVSSFSDGTIRFIFLVTLLLQPEDMRPAVMLIDEPELGLHPYAISVLAGLLKSAAASSNTQVLVTTQSPLLVNEFDPEDILIADRVDGSTTFERIEPNGLKDWLEEFSLGELWIKNHFGGRPVHEPE